MPITTYLRVEIRLAIRACLGRFARVLTRRSRFMDGASEYAQMKKPFYALYVGMDKALAGLGPQLVGADRYARAIVLIRERIAEVQDLGNKWIMTEPSKDDTGNRDDESEEGGQGGVQ